MTEKLNDADEKKVVDGALGDVNVLEEAVESGEIRIGA